MIKRNLLLLGLVSIMACNKNNAPTVLKGFVYTSVNGSDINKVVRFSRFSDGSLRDEKSFSTNSKGGANPSTGGDAHGDFDGQGAIQIIGNYLLVVNAGGNTVSVFSIDKSTGELTLKNNIDSHGERPVSITFVKKAASQTDYWVVVANQWNNPNIQKDAPNIERYPNDAWFTGDLTATDATDASRNIALFSFDGTSGNLIFSSILANYDRQNGGPTSVSFSADGSKLAVSTWGIAHFMTATPLLTEQRPSRVYVYDFNNTGAVSGQRFFEEVGIAGTIGFSWSGNSTIFASNFNLTPDKLNNSVTVLSDNGTALTKTSNNSVTTASQINEACWTILNATGSTLYVSSFGANLISTFSVNGTTLTLLDEEKRSKGLAPAGDTKDMYITPDSKFMYVLGAFQTFSINLFEIDADGSDNESQFILETTKGATPGQYNFLGIAGFDL